MGGDFSIFGGWSITVNSGNVSAKKHISQLIKMGFYFKSISIPFFFKKKNSLIVLKIHIYYNFLQFIFMRSKSFYFICIKKKKMKIK